MALRSDSYPDPAGIDTRTRYMENEAEAELALGMLRNMGDLYWMGQQESTLTDPRIERSWGGGACPEQHWGHLKDGRCFYLRMRHGVATLVLGAAGSDPNVDLPQVNPLYVREDAEAAYAAGTDYEHSFFLGPRPALQVYPAPDDDWPGYFFTREDRERTFSTLLDEILGQSTGTGWCAPSP